MSEFIENHMEHQADFFENIIQSSDDAIVSKTLDGIVKSWNPAAEMIFGYTAAEMIGQSMMVLFPPDRLEEENNIIEQIIQGERVDHFETYRIRKDHHLIHVSLTISPIYNEKNQIIGASKIARDITERKLYEQALVDSEKRFEGLYDHAPCGYHSLDRDGFIININQTELQWLGFAKEEVIGKMKITDFFNEAGKQKFKQNYPQFLVDGHIENLEFELIGKNDNVRLVSVNATAIKDNQGNLVKTRAVVHDITELKKSQLVIQLENQKNSILLSSASDGIHILDAQGNIVDFSDSFANMLGYSREETANLNVRDWDAYIDQEQLVSLVNDLMASYQTFETTHRRKDGSLLDVEIHAKGIILAGKHYLYASSRDITERKQAEARLRDSEERLALASLHNGVGIWDWNLTTGELVWDESMFALYHINRSDFSGAVSAWEKSLHPDDRERCDQEIQETLCYNKPFDTVFRVVWPNSEVHYIKAVAKLFHDETGKPVRMLGTNIDITERKQKEKIRIQQIEQQRDILVQEVHHRIKNHLQGLLGLLNLSSHKNTTEKAFLQDIIAKINSIAVVYGLQGQRYTSAPCLCEVVSEICKSIEAFSSTRLDFDYHRDRHVQLMKEYAVPIALIINELIINAVKHSKAEMPHSIAITLTVNENSAILHVQNSCDNQSKFPDFDQGVGLGLGLSLIRAMLPHQGVSLSLIQQDGLVSAKLELEKPVIFVDI